MKVVSIKCPYVNVLKYLKVKSSGGDHSFIGFSVASTDDGCKWYKWAFLFYLIILEHLKHCIEIRLYWMLWLDSAVTRVKFWKTLSKTACSLMIYVLYT